MPGRSSRMANPTSSSLRPRANGCALCSSAITTVTESDLDRSTDMTAPAANRMDSHRLHADCTLLRQVKLCYGVKSEMVAIAHPAKFGQFRPNKPPVISTLVPTHHRAATRLRASYPKDGSGRIRRAMNGRIFRTYVERCLAPTLAPGDIVIMDNL